eukprot:3931761-Rhodomonas_salina.3
MRACVESGCCCETCAASASSLEVSRLYHAMTSVWRQICVSLTSVSRSDTCENPTPSPPHCPPYFLARSKIGCLAARLPSPGLKRRNSRRNPTRRLLRMQGGSRAAHVGSRAIAQEGHVGSRAVGHEGARGGHEGA